MQAPKKLLLEVHEGHIRSKEILTTHVTKIYNRINKSEDLITLHLLSSNYLLFLSFQIVHLKQCGSSLSLTIPQFPC